MKMVSILLAVLGISLVHKTDKKFVQITSAREIFSRAGKFLEELDGNAPKTLGNTDIVWKYECIQTSTHKGYTMRTKLCNEMVSNFKYDTKPKCPRRHETCWLPYFAR